MRARKKPVVVEVEQFTGKAPDPAGVRRDDAGRPFVVTAHDQPVFLEPGDWIAPEPGGRGYYPIKADIFATTYEVLD